MYIKLNIYLFACLNIMQFYIPYDFGLVCVIKAYCLREERGTEGGMPSVGFFLRDPGESPRKLQPPPKV